MADLVKEQEALDTSFIPTNDRRGTEDIGNDDIQMPRLVLAQDMSPQLKKSGASYIAGLEPGHFFHSLTGEDYGPGPIYFYIVRAYKPRFVEFVPRSEGGGVRDPNVSPDDPRTHFGPDGEPPLATKFYDYLIIMEPIEPTDPASSMIAMSLKSTALKKARLLNGLIKSKNIPLFAGRYELRSVDERNTKGAFKNFSFKQAGRVPNAETFGLLESVYESVKDKDVIIPREPGDEPHDTSFDAGSM
jgi:hypothetical protein